MYYKDFKMKTYIRILSMLLILVITCTSCKKELEDRYNNPEESSIASIPNFFTALLNSNRLRPSYWEMRTFVLPLSAKYSQTASFAYGPTAYQQNDGESGQRWRDFYSVTFDNDNKQGTGINALYTKMAMAYEALPESEKANNEVFLQAAKVLLFDQAAQMVDLWGDIPFSETGSLVLTSSISNPKFDDAKEIYTTCINGLKEAAAYFKSPNLNSIATSGFKKQDILLSGNTEKWRRYANSLRLRLLMRTSFVDEANTRTQIFEMLSNPSEYPVIDGDGTSMYSPAATDILLQPLSDKKNNLRLALTEIAAYYAPDFLLNKTMLPVNDPRIPVMFDKFGETIDNVFIPNTEYRAMPITFTAAQQESDFDKYSIVDSATFLENQNLPGILMTAPEVNFIKAEAFERWGGGNAQATYELAVRQSVAFYYYLNDLNKVTRAPLSKPSDAVMNTFISTTGIAYTGSSEQKLSKIWTQKWVHFGFMQGIQAWSEYRRTKYPQLTFVPATLGGYEMPPTRLVYPTIETAYNISYDAIRSKDTRTAKIFWDVR